MSTALTKMADMAINCASPDARRAVGELGMHMAACLEMVLLFHRQPGWTEENSEQWKGWQIAAGIEEPNSNVTTKVLCDTIRRVLGKEVPS